MFTGVANRVGGKNTNWSVITNTKGDAGPYETRDVTVEESWWSGKEEEMNFNLCFKQFSSKFIL